MSEQEIKKLPSLTEQKKRVFLEIYRDAGTMREAAERADIYVGTAYDWIRQDAEFRDALEIARQEAGEALIREARRRAMKSSDNLLMFLIKKFDPSYRDNPKLITNIAPVVNVSSELKKLNQAELATIREAVYRIRSKPHDALHHEGGKGEGEE
jgi:transposase-like protein|tara:strand:+ start:166 stop:627 length:462 start_codon:yes stop_codon:yes gene_type:complete